MSGLISDRRAQMEECEYVCGADFLDAYQRGVNGVICPCGQEYIRDEIAAYLSESGRGWEYDR